MKIKPTKICKRKGCNKEFKLYKTTDKYCSFYCANLDQAKKEVKVASKIKFVSDKKRKDSYEYAKRRKKFLADPGNKFCIVSKVVFNEVRLATEVHHKAGRKGKLLLYVPYFLAVSRKAHRWIHENPEEAYKLGYLIKSSTINI